jgi:hypothetical protein
MWPHLPIDLFPEIIIPKKSFYNNEIYGWQVIVDFFLLDIFKIGNKFAKE